MLDSEGVGSASDRQHQVIADAADLHFCRIDGRIKLNCVNLARGRIVAVNRILAGTLAKDVGVVACPTCQNVGRVISCQYVFQAVARAADGSGAGEGKVLNVGTKGVVNAGLNCVDTSARTFGHTITCVIHNVGVVAKAARHRVGTCTTI